MTNISFSFCEMTDMLLYVKNTTFLLAIFFCWWLEIDLVPVTKFCFSDVYLVIISLLTWLLIAKGKTAIMYILSLFMYTFFCALIALHWQSSRKCSNQYRWTISNADDASLPDDRNLYLLHLRWTWSTSYCEFAGCTSQKKLHKVPFFTRLEDGNI